MSKPLRRRWAWVATTAVWAMAPLGCRPAGTATPDGGASEARGNDCSPEGTILQLAGSDSVRCPVESSPSTPEADAKLEACLDSAERSGRSLVLFPARMPEVGRATILVMTSSEGVAKISYGRFVDGREVHSGPSTATAGFWRRCSKLSDRKEVLAKHALPYCVEWGAPHWFCYQGKATALAPKDFIPAEGSIM